MPSPTFTDLDGSPLDNGRIYIGEAGLDPVTNPRIVYLNKEGTIAADQPIMTKGGYPSNNGTTIATLYIADDYSICVKNHKGSIVEQYLNRTNRTESSTVTFKYPAVGSIVRTVQDKLAENLSVEDFSGNLQLAIDRAISLGVFVVQLKAPAYNLGSTPVTGSGAITLIGSGKLGTTITYAGTGAAIRLTGWTGTVENVWMRITNAAGSAFEIGQASRNCAIKNTYGDATANPTTQSGAFVLLTAGSGHGFSGGLYLENNYGLQFKYGIHGVGSADPSDTWTSITGVGNYFVGNGSAIITGSRGIYFDALTNGIGSTFVGGTIEGFEYPFQYADGSLGASIQMDIEGNTHNMGLFGNTSSGLFETPFGVVKFRAANGTGLPFELSTLLQGEGRNCENVYPGYKLVYDGSGALQTYQMYRNAGSLINGASLDDHASKFAVLLGQAGVYGPEVHPNDHGIMISGIRVGFGDVVPSGDASGPVGSIRFTLTPTAGEALGWRRLTDGTWEEIPFPT